MRVAFSASVLAIAASLCFTAAPESQAAEASQGSSGRPPAGRSAAAAPASVAIGAVNNAFRFTNASFASGAVGLRNRSEGGIEVSGLTGAARFGLLYWAVITQGAPTAAHSNVYLRKGTDPFINVAGTRIGTGLSPCWFGDRTTVYRAVVPSSTASGNGFYTIRLRAGASGSTAGENPWPAVLSALPYVEGASLVIVGTGTATVSVYDIGFGGRMFIDTLTYQLNTASVAGATEVIFHNIGADGQIGDGLTAEAPTSNEVTTLNGLEIGGPDSPANDSDWNGAVAGPLPQLWDNTTHNVTTEALAGATPTVLPFVVTPPNDCLVTVANIVSVK